MSNSNIPGVTLSNGATTITVPPMNLRILFDEATKDDVDLVMRGSKDDPKVFQQAAINVILACARRNHPQLSRDQLLDVLDAADLGPLLVAVLTKSGFTSLPLGTKPPITTTSASAAVEAFEGAPTGA
jgi:hypothetical protein